MASWAAHAFALMSFAARMADSPSLHWTRTTWSFVMEVTTPYQRFGRFSFAHVK